MEALGAFSDGEWDSFAALFSSQELNQSPFPLADNAAPAPGSTDLQLPYNGGSGFHNSSWFYSLDAFDPSLQSAIKQDMSCSSCSTDSSSSFLFSNSSDMFMSIDDKSFGSSFFSNVLMEEVDKALCAVDEDARRDRFENVQGSQPPLQLGASAVAGKELIPVKRKHDEPKLLTEADGKVNNSDFSDNRKKKTRVSRDEQKNKKAQQSKKTQKTRGVNVEEEGNAAACDGQSSISCSSDDEYGSQGGSATTSDGLNGKTRASRGSATDPQSLYARKRRERINERLRILQRLVPNGTKVDISTMLEEAVHYVKFLQLQIKLLSSDDMWMFAPLAYNGMDIGFHQKLSPFLSQ